LATSMFGKLVEKLNAGACTVRSTVAGEISIPVEFIDHKKGGEFKKTRIIIQSGQSVDLCKKAPGGVLKGNKKLKDAILSRQLVIV